MTPEDIKRLMELMGKSDRNAAEQTELDALQTKANGLAPTAKKTTPAPKADDGGVSLDDLKATIAEAVKANGGGLTAEDVTKIVTDATKGISTSTAPDAKAIALAVKEAQGTQLTADDVKTIVADAFKNLPSKSKMQHPEDPPVIEGVTSMTKGNLPVAFKQLLNVMTRKDINDGITADVLTKADQKGRAQESKMFQQIRAKALTTDGAGTGLEFMNSTLSSQVLQRLYMESQLAQAFTAGEVVMPSDPFQYPLSTTRPEFRRVAQLGTPTASDPGTGKLILTTNKLVGLTEYSYEADEDALIAILPHILSQLGEAGGDALEDAIINGDTAGTHQDSDTEADGADNAATIWDGIRKLTLAQASLKVSLATGGISAANTLAMKKALKKWGLRPKDLLIVAGVGGYNDFIGLPETLTAEKTGNAATARIYTGQAPNLYGIDIIASARVREDLNASGVFDGVTETKGSFLIVHKPSWIQGVRRGFTIETDRDTKLQKNWVVASFRRDFKPMESLANTKAAVIGYNFDA